MDCSALPRPVSGARPDGTLAPVSYPSRMTILEWYELSAVTFLLGEKLIGYGLRYRHNRFVEPKLQLRQVFLDQSQWYEERAAKLAAFHWQLGMLEKPDKWKLAELVAKLDPHDRQFAMKQEDVAILREWVSRKGQECHDNAAQSSRMADEVKYRILSD